MDFQNDKDLAELLKQQDEQKKQAGYMTALGSALDSAQSIPSAHQLLYGGKAPEPTASKVFSAVNSMQTDPLERQAKAMAYLKQKREATHAQASDDSQSPDSVAYQQQIGTLFPGLRAVTEGKSKSQIESMMPLLTQKIKGDVDRQTALLARGERLAAKKDERAEKLAKETEERTTPYGVARTADDAKKLKEAGEIKTDMDRKIQELIDLREKYGAESYNREAVARAGQLSKDLLLQKKQLANLGVLSKTDMDLVDSIIPADPLQFNMSQLWGQDPTMTKLKSFKSDTNKEFNDRLNNRLKSSQPNEQRARAVVKTQTNKKTGEQRVVYDDGSTEIISSNTAGK